MALRGHRSSDPQPGEPGYLPTHSEAALGQDRTAHHRRHSPNALAMQAIEHTRDAAAATERTVHKLLELFERMQDPPELRTIVIDALHNPIVDPAFEPAASIGVYNPNSLAVFLGFAGESANPNNRAPSVPPNSLAVFPVQPADLEVGVDPIALAALGAGATAVLWLFRYRTVQPAYLGKGA